MGTASRPKATTRITGLTVEFPVHFRHGQKGRRRLRQGTKPTPTPVAPGRIPRISRLTALAIHFDNLIRQGVVRDYAELAQLSNVSRARISQIGTLLQLAPDIAEDILFMPRTLGGRDSVTERSLRRITSEIDWDEQRQLWFECTRDSARPRMRSQSRES